MIQAIKNLNMLQRNGMSLKQKVTSTKKKTNKFQIKTIKSTICDYSDAYILVKVERGKATTKVAFKKCAPFSTCKTETNDFFVDEVHCIHFVLPMYNLIEYSKNYSDTSGSLWQSKKDEIEHNAELAVDNNGIFKSSSFKFRSNHIEDIAANGTNTKM